MPVPKEALSSEEAAMAALHDDQVRPAGHAAVGKHGQTGSVTLLLVVCTVCKPQLRLVPASIMIGLNS